MRFLQAFWIAVVAAGVVAKPAHAAQAPVGRDIPIALLVDLSNGQVLYSKQPRRRFVPASVTKVMTAYTAFELVQDGKLALDRPVFYSPELERDWYGEGSNMFLRAGETPTVAQLLLGITTISGNDASFALALEAKGSLAGWLDAMNANAEELGMADTNFGSPNGFPDEGQTYTTAHDLVLLGRALTQDHAGMYRRFFGHSQLTWRNITQQNHDPVTRRVAGADGIKTGFTSEAGFTFMGSAKRGSRRLMMVLAGAPSQQERDEAARDLLEWGFANFTSRTLLDGNSVLGEVRVQDGARRSVALVTETGLAVALPAGVKPEALDLKLSYRGPVTAPIAAGQSIATLTVAHNGKILMQTPVVARDSVAEANMFERIGNALASWLG